MKRYILKFMASLAGCSSTDNPLVPKVQESMSGYTVVENGIQRVPVVVPQGTRSVTLSYDKDGEQVVKEVPFVETNRRENDALVGGYVQLYSEKPALVSLKAGNQVLTENLKLSGRVLAPKKATRAYGDLDGNEQDAYFFVRFDGEVLPNATSGESSRYYPRVSNPDTKSEHVFYRGRIRTDLSAYALQWKENTADHNTTHYIYSADGSAVAATIVEQPDVNALLQGTNLTFNPETQKVIWYVTKFTYGSWHVDGVIVKKETQELKDDAEKPKNLIGQSVTSVHAQDATAASPAQGVLHNGGVAMFESDGDMDYNDLVVDFDVETRYTEENFPYVKLVMHLRALSVRDIRRVALNLDGFEDLVAAEDDFAITVRETNIQNTPKTDETDPSYNLPDFRDTGLTVGRLDNQGLEAGNVQWLLENGNQHGWFKLDASGWYNVTQEDFNGKPFMTVEAMHYPKEGADVQGTVNKLISTLSHSFLLNGVAAEPIIVPTLTPHTAEGFTLRQAFPTYPTEGWWSDAKVDDAKVVHIK